MSNPERKTYQPRQLSAGDFPIAMDTGVIAAGQTLSCGAVLGQVPTFLVQLVNKSALQLRRYGSACGPIRWVAMVRANCGSALIRLRQAVQAGLGKAVAVCRSRGVVTKAPFSRRSMAASQTSGFGRPANTSRPATIPTATYLAGRSSSVGSLKMITAAASRSIHLPMALPITPDVQATWADLRPTISNTFGSSRASSGPPGQTR
ncbi:hypothetical protein PSWA111526_07705 [Pseudomonas wadenswilerensis]|uniref:Uncharacterized protein n=1 Tax=Pseudomonas wadenswilerensis TaxID=1785161 RepID=A0A380T489_9PSED|nr:hypothetical protein CCOS864_04231 [Pseudomonas wadenswilerensis]